MNSIPRASGIYQILCVPTGKIYIGSTYDFRKRWKDHRNDLLAGRHKSSYLQRAWDKYGETSFEFSILEVVMFIEDLQVREQAWLDSTRCYDRTIGFNTCSVAGVTTGIKLSLSARLKMSLGRRGKPKSESHVINQADSLASDWLITTPDGEQIRIHNLTAFCREHGLDQGRMIRIANGQKKNKSHKGYMCIRLSPKKKQHNAKF